MSQVSAAEVKNAQVASVQGLTSNAITAPVVKAITGQAVSPLIKSLPKSSSLSVSVVINGKNVSLGKVSTNSKGEVLLPAIASSKAGTFTVAIKSSSGKTYYTKINFASKK